MSDTIMTIYVIVAIGLVTALILHSAMKHKRMVSILLWWTFIGVFLCSIGGLLMLGSFTPNMADYSYTSREFYNAFTWGGIEFPEYNEILTHINNLGIVINSLGLGVLVMAVLSGFFPRSFFPPVSREQRFQSH